MKTLKWLSPEELAALEKYYTQLALEYYQRVVAYTIEKGTPLCPAIPAIRKPQTLMTTKS